MTILFCNAFWQRVTRYRKKRGEGKNRVVLELLLPKPGGHVLSPYFDQRRSWAVIKMGLEDTYIQRVVESASCVDLG